MKIRKNLWAWLFSLFVFTIVSFRNAPVTWVAIGDSITYLNDHLEETGYRVSKGYLTNVTGKLKNVHYLNRGRNGWTAVDFAKNINQIDFGIGEVYTIFLGTNDWWQGRPVGVLTDYTNRQGAQTFYGAIRVIMDKIRGLNPHASIILITPMQRADFVYIADHTNNAYGSYKLKNGQSLEMFATAILEIAKLENLPAIDLYHDPAFDIRHMVHYKKVKNPATGHYQRYHYPWVSDLPFDAKTDEYPYPNSAINMTYDGLHPSNKGNRIIADRIVNVFRYKLKI